jgi:NADPH:quinone reductase-like Zn-dependent oxidoreductase
MRFLTACEDRKTRSGPMPAPDLNRDEDKPFGRVVKAARIHDYGGLDSIRIERIALPTLRAGEILIEVRATGVNPIDWKIPAGQMQRIMPLKLPFTLGGDFSGVVLDTGPGASPFSIGEEVYGHAPIFMGSSGAFAEALITLGGNVARKPRGIGHPQAAALPLAGVSALQSLTERLRLVRNQRILIHCGAGGVGSIAIQLAKHLGAQVVTTVSTDDVAYAKSLGADEIIDYRRQRFEEAVGKVDAVLDTVGGDIYVRSFNVLKQYGRLVSLLERPQQAHIRELGVEAYLQITHVTSARLQRLAALVEDGAVKVHIDDTFSLDRAAAALSHLAKASPRDKLVLRIA